MVWCILPLQDVSINKYFDDAMLLELAKHEADKEMEME
jgi:hypothetical protein